MNLDPRAQAAGNKGDNPDEVRSSAPDSRVVELLAGTSPAVFRTDRFIPSAVEQVATVLCDPALVDRWMSVHGGFAASADAVLITVPATDPATVFELRRVWSGYDETRLDICWQQIAAEPEREDPRGYVLHFEGMAVPGGCDLRLTRSTPDAGRLARVMGGLGAKAAGKRTMDAVAELVVGERH